MLIRRIASTIACLSALGLFAAAPASAETLRFTVRSTHPNLVRIAFHSTERNHVWPGPGASYRLEDNDKHSIAISCEEGENVCYGAWVDGDSSIYWGVGYKNEHRCTSCCWHCDGSTPQISLTR